MKCFYHIADFDGECSAAIIKINYPNCNLIPINYGDNIDFSEIMSNEQIWIVDFSFLPDKMDELINKVGQYNITWIDHHKTAIENTKYSNLNGNRQIEQAACELTWKFVNPNKTMPAAIKLLSWWDVWNLKYKDIVFSFQYGMKINKTNPLINLNFWEKLFDAEIQIPIGTVNGLFYKILSEGEIIYKYIRNTNEIESKKFSFETEIEGYKAICVNRPGTTSDFFEPIEKEKNYDLQVSFYRKSEKWYISLRSNKIDVNKIAKKYGGGGHKGSAGFECKKIPFEF